MSYLYSNIRFWKSLRSPGILSGDSETARASQVNKNLLDDINSAALKAGVIPIMTTLREGKHASSSRHYTGDAVDIASFVIDGKSVGGQDVKPFMEAGDKLSAELQKLGYKLNVEKGQTKSVLWRTNTGGNHFNHLHVSNRSGSPSTYNPNANVEGFSSNGSPSSDTPLTAEPTGLKYFHFDRDFIDRGIRLYKEYYNKQDINDNKEGRGSGDIGFVPLTLNMTLDGISGWVIYDKLRINQKLLPPQYPKNFNFVIMGISHSLQNQNWITNIETLSVPDLKTKKWNITANLTASPIPTTPSSSGNTTYVAGGAYQDTSYRDTKSDISEEIKKICSDYRGTQPITEFEFCNLIAGINAESGHDYREEAYTAAAILNRSRSKSANIKSVMFEKGQFSSVIGGSVSWIYGPTTSRRNHIYEGIKKYLKEVPKNIQFFASNDPKAYETKTDKGNGATKIAARKQAGYVLIGNSLFGSRGV